MRNSLSRLSLIIMLPALFLLAGCSGSAEGQTPDDAGYVAGDGSITIVAPDQRVEAPNLTGTTLEGQPWSLESLRGSIVPINVWASWCAPCRAEAPALEETSQKYAGQGVEFIGLNTRDSQAAARAFVDRYAITYPNVYDPDGALQLLIPDLPPQAIPSTIFIDADGRVAARILGEATTSQLAGVIDELRSES